MEKGVWQFLLNWIVESRNINSTELFSITIIAFTKTFAISQKRFWQPRARNVQEEKESKGSKVAAHFCHKLRETEERESEIIPLELHV